MGKRGDEGSTDTQGFKSRVTVETTNMVSGHNTTLRRPSLAAVFATEEEENDYSTGGRNTPTAVTSSPHNNNNCKSRNITPPTSCEASPYYLMSPWNHPSPYTKSPWIIPSPASFKFANNGLIGSIVREEGHVYSLTASGDLLYAGSDSKNVRVWKNLKEFTGFKSNSGLVKAIVIYEGKIFTGHQDGKIRIWKVSARNPSVHKRIGSLPTFKDYVKSSVNPKNYVEVRRHRNSLRIKHYDAISSLSLNEELGLLYSGSWDKTLKVWRISDYKCLESIPAHDDAINAVAVGFDDLAITGSADGTVKVWKRKLQGKGTKHFLVQTLLKQENAVTAVVVNQESAVLYCGSSDGLVNFWERKKHLSHGGVLRGHKMAVLCLATAGNLVFSGSADKSICVWRREAGGFHICLSVLTGHGGPIKCLAVDDHHHSQDSDDQDDQGWILYSGSLDKSVKVWRVREHAPELREYQSPRKSYSSPPQNSKPKQVVR